MNYTKIINFNDLQNVINENILITGDIKQQQEELYFNTYELAFDKDFIKTLSLSDLNNFFHQLIQMRSQQVFDLNKGPATFYAWFDEQYLTLCFNVLSGTNIKLPFGFHLNVLNNPLKILQKFHTAAYDDQNYLTWENITIFKPGDPEFDDDEDEEDFSNYILDVFFITLPQSKLSTFLQDIIS